MGRRQQRMQESADKFAHALDGGVRLRVRGPREQARPRHQPGTPPPAALPPPPHALMMPKRKQNPSAAITPPPVCTTAFPQGQRVSRPRRDAAEMQQPGRHDEADRIGERVRSVRQFRAVRVPVEDGRKIPTMTLATQSGGRAAKAHRQPEHDRRERDAKFHARQRHAQHPERPRQRPSPWEKMTGNSHIAGATEIRPP